MAKLSQAEQELQKQGRQVGEMVQTKGWVQVLKPWLEDRIHHSWVDPRQFKSDKEYAYAMKTAWGFAQAAEEILAFVDKVKEESEMLTKKEKDEIKDKLREAVS